MLKWKYILIITQGSGGDEKNKDLIGDFSGFGVKPSKETTLSEGLDSGKTGICLNRLERDRNSIGNGGNL